MCTHIHQHDGVPGVRRILSVLALAKKHGPAVIDDAAKAALEIGVPTYRFLRKYVERRPPVPLTLRQVDPLIWSGASMSTSASAPSAADGCKAGNRGCALAAFAESESASTR